MICLRNKIIFDAAATIQERFLEFIFGRSICSFIFLDQFFLFDQDADIDHRLTDEKQICNDHLLVFQLSFD